MKHDRAVVGAVLVVLVAANAAYAFGVGPLLNDLYPTKPLGVRDVGSPVTNASAPFVPVETGIDVRRMAWQETPPYPAVVTGGMAAADIDGDGWQDLYFSPGGPDHPARLYRNLGAFRFEDVTVAAGLNATGHGAGAVFGDVDADGDPDLYALIDDRGVLYRNDDGVFTDITEAAGVGLEGLCGAPCQPGSATWLDHDLDGDLDLYVVNNLDWRDEELRSNGHSYESLVFFGRPQRSVLFENRDGVFTDVTKESGTWDTGKGLAVTASDVDGDGLPDILTANDVTKNAYFHNEGDRFTDIARETGVDETKTGMGVQTGDVDGDGRLDFVISNFRGHGLSLYMQREDGTFRYATEDAGLGRTAAATGWGVQLFDADLDGDLDLAYAAGRATPLEPHEKDLHNVLFPKLKDEETDQLYLYDGGFAEARGAIADGRITRALLAVDLDNDGDQDIVRVHLADTAADVLRNDMDKVREAGAHGWLQLDLEGTASNRDGFGTRIEATLPDGRVLVREHVAAAGFQTGMPSVLTIGLGPHQGADVVLHWPSGTVQQVQMETGRHVVVEPDGEG